MECFKIYSEELEGRIDPFYYKPDLLNIENQVKKKSKTIMNDFILKIAGGATPSRNLDNELYATEKDGIPFLRVQNITENGLVLNDVKYITKVVHQGQLKRSQLNEGDLLVTITGRIASSCVVPEGFEGNINQHSVVIKTKNKETSEALAVYLNSSVGHSLAIRRTSGGSRPALDYEALKSIPVVINSEIVDIIDKAYSQKKSKEAEARNLIDSIDSYVLTELGIELPEMKHRMTFTVNSADVEGNRIDAYYYQPMFEEIENALSNSEHNLVELDQITRLIKTGTTPNQKLQPFTKNKDIVFFRNSNLKKNKLAMDDVKYIKNELKDILTYSKYNDLLICIAGTIGLAAINTTPERMAINQNVSALEIDENIALTKYISIILNLAIYEMLFWKIASLATILYINNSNLKSIKIPVPPLPVQEKIASEVRNRMEKAEKLRQDAADGLDKAKKEVESIILS